MDVSENFYTDTVFEFGGYGCQVWWRVSQFVALLLWNIESWSQMPNNGDSKTTLHQPSKHGLNYSVSIRLVYFMIRGVCYLFYLNWWAERYDSSLSVLTFWNNYSGALFTQIPIVGEFVRRFYHVTLYSRTLKYAGKCKLWWSAGRF